MARVVTHRWRIVTCALGAAVAVLVLIAAQLAPAADAAPGLAVGLEQNGGMADPATRTALLDTQRGLGATVIRYVLRYDQVATCDPARVGLATAMDNRCYDFSVPDAVVRGARARGMDVILSVYGVPKWEFGGPENYTGTTDAQFDAFAIDYADFVQAATTRYDGAHGQPRVEQWTIWNEPNGTFMEPRFDAAGAMIGPQRYARMYDRAARRLKAVDPTLLVAVGPTAPMERSLLPIRFAEVVLPLLQQYGSPVDAWAHNGYMGSQSVYASTIRSPRVGLANIDDLVRLVDSYPVSRGARVWITEFGYQTAPASTAVSLDRQAELLGAAVRFAYEHPRIDSFIWYSLLDDGPVVGSVGFQAGLFHDGGQACGGSFCAKPAAGVFRHTIYASPRSAAGSVLLWGQGRLQPASTRIFVRRPGDGWRAYANADTASTGTVSIRLSLPLGTEVMTCDIRCGATRRVAAGRVQGGGGVAASSTRTVRRRLGTVRLSRRASLAGGIRYATTCSRCTVRASIYATGIVSRIPAARRRLVYVAHGKITRSGSRHAIHLRFTSSAKRQLARVRTSVLVIRTVVRTPGSRLVTVTERTLVLR